MSEIETGRAENTVPGLPTGAPACPEARAFADAPAGMTFDETIEKSIRMKARKICAMPGFTRDDFEDIAQELRMELLEYLPRFDPSKGKRSTLVARVIEHRAASVVRHRQAQLRMAPPDTRSLQEELVTDAGTAPLEGVVTVVDRDRRLGTATRPEHDHACLKLDLDEVIAGLPEDLRRLCEDLKTKTVKRIAQERKVGRERIYGDLARLRRFFEEKNLKEYLYFPRHDGPGLRM